MKAVVQEFYDRVKSNYIRLKVKHRREQIEFFRRQAALKKEKEKEEEKKRKEEKQKEKEKEIKKEKEKEKGKEKEKTS